MRRTHRSRIAHTVAAMAIAVLLALGSTGSMDARIGEDLPSRGPKAHAEESKGLIDTLPIASARDLDVANGSDVMSGALVDGGFVIGSNVSYSLRFFKLDGSPVRAVGHFGRDSAGFEDLTWVQSIGNRLYVNDRSLGRVSELDSRGKLLAIIQPKPTPSYDGIVVDGVFSDGSLCITAFPHAAPFPRGEVRTVRATFDVLRLDGTGRLRNHIMVAKADERLVQPLGERGQRILPVPLGRKTQVVVGADRVYMIQNDNDSIHVSDERGRALTSLSAIHPWERVRVTAEDVRVARDHFMKTITIPELRSGLRKALEASPVPRFLPPYGWAGTHTLALMKRTSSGDVWVLEFGGLHSLAPTWAVYAPSGRPRGRVRAMSEIDLLDADTSTALVRVWDENQHDRVELRKITWAK